MLIINMIRGYILFLQAFLEGFIIQKGAWYARLRYILAICPLFCYVEELICEIHFVMYLSPNAVPSMVVTFTVTEKSPTLSTIKSTLPASSITVYSTGTKDTSTSTYNA